jgi:hypothetical protein
MLTDPLINPAKFAGLRRALENRHSCHCMRADLRADLLTPPTV